MAKLELHASRDSPLLGTPLTPSDHPNMSVRRLQLLAGTLPMLYRSRVPKALYHKKSRSRRFQPAALQLALLKIVTAVRAHVPESEHALLELAAGTYHATQGRSSGYGLVVMPEDKERKVRQVMEGEGWPEEMHDRVVGLIAPPRGLPSVPL